MRLEETRVDISDKYILLSNIMYLKSERDLGLLLKEEDTEITNKTRPHNSGISEDEHNYHLDLFLPTERTLTDSHVYKCTTERTVQSKSQASEIQRCDIKLEDTLGFNQTPAKVSVSDDAQLEDDSLLTTSNGDQHLIKTIVPEELSHTLKMTNQSAGSPFSNEDSQVLGDLEYDSLNKDRIQPLHKVSSASHGCSNIYGDNDMVVTTPTIPSKLQPEYRMTRLPLPPLVVFIHGGGWRRGDRLAWKHFVSVFDTNVLVALITWVFNLYHNIGESFAAHGIACAIVSYPRNRLEFPWLLLEVMTSYICSAVCFSFLYWIMFTLLLSCVPYHPYFTFEAPSLLLQMLCFTNTCILLLMTLFRKNYKLETKKVYLLWFPFGTMILLISIAIAALATPLEDLSTLYFYTSLILTQGFIILNITQAPTAKHPVQARACVQAVRFLSDFGVRTRNFDVNNIFLMGHSAGAHLATLVALNSELSAYLPNIKGVISVSGIHNLTFLSSWFLTRHLYLLPTFGSQPHDWSSASPITHVPTLLSTDRKPSFLIISGEKERNLCEDADNFHRKLVESGFTSERLVVPNTGHFKVILMFMQYAPKCVNFVYAQYTAK